MGGLGRPLLYFRFQSGLGTKVNQMYSNSSRPIFHSKSTNASRLCFVFVLVLQFFAFLRWMLNVGVEGGIPLKIKKESFSVVLVYIC